MTRPTADGVCHVHRIRTLGRGIRSLAGLGALALAPISRTTPPQPSRGFHLFTRIHAALRTNNVSCLVRSDGHVCADSGSTRGGGFWPRGTVNQYLFASGLQMAGIIGPDGAAWAGDTTGAIFLAIGGVTEHGSAFSPMYDSRESADAASWPSYATIEGTPYHATVLGQPAASEQDLYWLMWESDTAASGIRARPHPLGVLVEGRALAWKHPAGNDDVVYFVYTFYNITAHDAATYAGARPSIRPVLLDAGIRFHQAAQTAYGITLPAAGYTIIDFAVGIASDPDVAYVGLNYVSVNLPLGIDLAWEQLFSYATGWTLEPIYHSDPFFAGAGFVGSKFLATPSGPPIIAMYSNLDVGGAFGIAQNTSQLFRFLTGRFDPTVDSPCNNTAPNICYINNTAPRDAKDYQAALPITLGPGGAVSLVVAEVFAAPVADPACVPPCDIKPGDPGLHGDPLRMAGGVNTVDRLAGYLGFTDADGNGAVDQYEYLTVPRSLYGKAQVAQAFYDHQFLVPQAPAAPDFFLVPGDDHVTVLWRPSPTEETGDPYFAAASGATTIPPGGTAPTPNPLYDPNFRQFDVEGYRVYRARVDDPGAMEMLAQFDYTGTAIHDFSGQVNPGPFCAPEIGVGTGCATTFDPIVPGATRSAHIAVPIAPGTGLIQVRLGERSLQSNGTVHAWRADTLAAGNAEVALGDTGVPFVYVDTDVLNSFRYFYAVTAFDVNSWQSGPSSQESPRALKAVTPTVPATNHVLQVTDASGIYGRGVRLDPTAPNPTLDQATGRFSGPFPPSDAWNMELTGFVPELFSGTQSVVARLDSLRLGSPYASTFGEPHEYWFTLSGSGGGSAASVMLPINQPAEVGLRRAETALPLLLVDPVLAARYGGAGTYGLPGSLAIEMEGPDYHSLYGRGCFNGRFGFRPSSTSGCAYNGSRWFDGPSPDRNETRVDPIAGNTETASFAKMVNPNNAGALTGVTLIHNTQAYQSASPEYRGFEGIKSGARRAADFNVYWGAGGRIDSVIDVTHNVVVPFAADHLGGTWGILNPGVTAASFAGAYDQRPELTNFDFNCVPPMNQYSVGATCVGGPVYQLSRTAVPGPVVPFSGGDTFARTDPVWPDAGVGLYLSGDIFTFGLAGGRVPSSGTVWSLRTYIGAISGGNGDGGNYGPYQFSDGASSARKVPRSWTAVGTEVRVTFDVTNRVNPATAEGLDRVHPVPDPYYFTSDYDDQDIKFVNLPAEAIIRVYSMSGVLVTLLEHHSTTGGGEASWNARNRTGRRVAPGVYFYHIESGDARRVGRMLVVNARR